MTTSSGPAPPTTTSAAPAYAPAQLRAPRLLGWILVIAGLLSFAYMTLSAVVATQLIYSAPQPITRTPAALDLRYQDVTFYSRGDHVRLQAWFIPGLLSNGELTDDRTIIVVHGKGGNRDSVLDFSADLAHHGFAVFSFDMRGMGTSAPAPLTLGYFEQRDVLGAVDYLRTGSLPFPDLGHPRIIGGWGVSMGAATILLAAAQESAIAAVVSDGAYADIIPILQREIPKHSHLPGAFTPGTLEAANILFGVDYYSIRPEDVVARIAPRPIFFINGDADTYIPPSNMTALVDAASAAPDAQVQFWLVPGAKHSQSYAVAKSTYIQRVTDFFDTALGADINAA
jgi:fermentation-respiration switch protein FrsA (DUF1100 family)